MRLGVLDMADLIADTMKAHMYPLYQLGRAAQGDAAAFAFVTVLIGGIFALVYLALSRSFFRLTAMQKGAAGVKYKRRTMTARSADSALFRKELGRFTASANYMLNCGLGILFMLIMSVVILWKGSVAAQMLPLLYEGAEEIIPLVLAAALCLMASMNDISAPSVSLEGENIWIVQSSPVSPWQVLKAKLRLHLTLTLIPAMVATVCTFIALRPGIPDMLLILAVLLLFIITMAQLGLFLNLKTPNLKWTNEIVPIKQSFSVTVALFGGWGIIMAFGGLYFLVRNFLGTHAFLAAVCVVLAMASAVLYTWLKNRGARIFASL